MNKNSHAFTIVELLIVIVVIAILASISVVAYTGVQDRANDSVVQSDLRQTLQNMMVFHADNGRYPLAGNYNANAQIQAELNSVVVATRSAYFTDSNAYLYCRDDEMIVLVAKSKSGQGFYAGTHGSGRLESWPGNGNAQLCPAVGIPSGHTYAWFYAAVDNVYRWEPWFTGTGQVEL